MRTSVWKMMKSLLRTAQNAPAGWLGTVLPLHIRDKQCEKRKCRLCSLDVGHTRWINESCGSVYFPLQRNGLARLHEAIHGFYIIRKGHNIAGGDEEESNDAEDTNTIQAKESI